MKYPILKLYKSIIDTTSVVNEFGLPDVKLINPEDASELGNSIRQLKFELSLLERELNPGLHPNSRVV